MNIHDNKFSDLRARAEKLLEPSELVMISDSISQSITDINHTLHELYTYRIELELQNEELLNTQIQLQEVSQGYLDFYNYASVAYVSLDHNNHIIKANNALASLLGLPRQKLFKQRFTDFVLFSDQDTLYLYRQALLDHKNPDVCEIRLYPSHGQILWVKCEGFFSNSLVEPEMNLVLTDISEYKQAEAALQDLFNHQEIVREEEKTNIEREINNTLGTELYALKRDLNSLRKQLPEDQASCHEKCALLQGHIEKALQSVGKITSNLRPGILDQLGLFAAITDKLREFQQLTGIHCDLILPEKTSAIDKNLENTVFRILQEALTNIAIHSRATSVNLELKYKPTLLSMKLSDNGCGMSKTQMHQAGKFGILGMEQRARLLGGEIDWLSEIDKGSTLILTMPIRAH